MNGNFYGVNDFAKFREEMRKAYPQTKKSYESGEIMHEKIFDLYNFNDAAVLVTKVPYEGVLITPLEEFNSEENIKLMKSRLEKETLCGLLKKENPGANYYGN
ncbi:MAG: hypothetical protein NUV46_00095 [Nanoarchaeota archaeon]|nr:hypothetical protein [Nanoarchaeota archaeon]